MITFLKKFFSQNSLANLLVFFMVVFFIVVSPLIAPKATNWSPFESAKIITALVLISLTMSGLFILHLRSPLSLKLNTFMLGFAGFLLTMLISSLFSLDPNTSFWGLNQFPTGSFISYLLVFLFLTIFFHFKHLFQPSFIIHLILLSGFLVAGYGIVQHFNLDPVDWWNYKEAHLRAFSTLGNPIQFGMFVGTISILSLGKIFLQPEKNGRLLIYFFIWIILTLGTLFSGSRAPIISQGLMFMGIIFLALFFRKSIPHLKLKVAALLVVFTAMHTFNYYENKKNALADRLNATGDGLKVRTNMWAVGLKAGLQHPLLGIGPEMFYYAYHKNRPAEHNIYQTWNQSVYKAHNELVDLWVTQGLLGLVGFLFLAFIVIKRIGSVLLSPRDGPTRIEFFFVFAAIFYLFANNLFVFNVFPTLVLSGLLPALFYLDSGEVERTVIKSDKKTFAIVVKSALIVFFFGLSFNGVTDFFADEVFAQASLARAKQEFPKAVQLVEKAIKMNPTRDHFHCLLSGLISNGRLFKMYQSRSFTDSDIKRTFTEVTDRCTAGPSIHYNIWYQAGMSAANMGLVFPEFFKNSLAYFEESEKLSPTDPLTQLQKSTVAYKMKDHEASQRYIDKALQLKPDFLEGYYVKLDFLYQLKRPDDINNTLRTMYNYDWTKSIYAHRIYYFESIRELAAKYKDITNEVALYQFIYEQKKRGVD